MEFVLIGVASAFNLLIIKVKTEKKRYEDAIFDAAMMILLAFLFGGSYGGMVVAMIASMIISLWLLVSPPKFFSTASEAIKKEFEELNPDKNKKPKKGMFDL